jgi:hypothetical protein
MIVLCEVFYGMCFYVQLSFRLCEILAYYLIDVQLLGSATTNCVLCIQETYSILSPTFLCMMTSLMT